MANYYRIRKGLLRTQGYISDFDSPHFQPEEPIQKAKQRIALRLEGCDCLEVNYLSAHQPQLVAMSLFDDYAAIVDLGSYSVNQLKNNVLYAENTPTIWVALGDLDSFGRTLAWVWVENCPYDAGQTISSAEMDVSASLNVALARQGLVYPYLSIETSQNLRNQISDAFTAAQGEVARIWGFDTTSNFPFNDPFDVQSSEVIWPALFRYLCRFYNSRSSYFYLSVYNQADQQVVYVGGQATTFGSLINVSGSMCGIDLNTTQILFG